jgi:hypothetical protein
VTDKNLAHDPRPETQDMGPVMPAGLALAQETEIRFMDKGGWLQGMSWPFAS